MGRKGFLVELLAVVAFVGGLVYGLPLGLMGTVGLEAILFLTLAVSVVKYVGFLAQFIILALIKDPIFRLLGLWDTPFSWLLIIGVLSLGFLANAIQTWD